MIFRSFQLNVNESNAFVLACDETREALLVDVGALAPEIEDFLSDNQLSLVKIFITHDHFDHTGGLAQAVGRYGAEVLCGKTGMAGHGTRPVAHGDEVRIGTLAGKVLATPGHTPDSISLVFPGLAFTGDALFAGSVGGTTSPARAGEQIDAIREHILSLPDDYEIHPGHGPASTVGIERAHNPFLV